MIAVAVTAAATAGLARVGGGVGIKRVPTDQGEGGRAEGAQGITTRGG